MDPRRERTRQVAHEAALALLARGGIAELNPQNLSRASGLGRTTLYRHWPTTRHLVVDLLTTYRMPDFEVPAGDLATRIRVNVERQHERLLDPQYSLVYRTIQAIALDPEVESALVEIHRERVRSVVRCLSPDYDLAGRPDHVITVLALINGPVVDLSTFTGASSPGLAPAIVASVLAYLQLNCA